MSEQQALSSRLADDIVELITENGLGPGDPIESARNLAQRFEVTTPTVREALRRLEATDIIRFRHGSGTYVGNGLYRRLVLNPHSGSSRVGSVGELIEARILIEPSIAAAAARNRTESQLVAIEDSTTNALTPQRGNERPASLFHVEVATASGNALMAELIDALMHVRSADQVAIRQHYADRERDHAEHKQIFEAIRDQDAAAAERLTRAHLESIQQVVMQHLTNEGEGA